MLRRGPGHPGLLREVDRLDLFEALGHLGPFEELGHPGLFGELEEGPLVDAGHIL